MTIRVKTISALVILSVLGVLISTSLVLQRAIADKRSYATELNSILAPQLRSAVDVKIGDLLQRLEEFDERKSNSTLTQIKNIPGISALFFADKNKKIIFIQFDTSQKLETVRQSVEKLNLMSVSGVEEGKLTYMTSQTFLFNTRSNRLIGVVLSAEFMSSAFEQARGKDSYITNSTGQVLFKSQTTSELIDHSFPIDNLNKTGADTIATEVKTTGDEVKSVSFSKLKNLKDSYVTIFSEKAAWKNLAAPIVKSSVSLIVILILISVLFAFSISSSLARPIERISEETAKIGIGEWNPITVDGSSVEVSKLASAFNNMIGNLKKREGELKVANSKLIQSESLAAVGRIGAGVAHEVKNPLSSILSYCQLLEIQLKTSELTPEKTEKIKNYNKMIMDDTRRASRIISDLLTFSRQKELLFSKVSLKNFLQEAEPKLRAFCETAGVSFKIVDASLSDTTNIDIDTDQIYQVLFNLVQNAVYALKENQTVEKIIEVSCKISGNQVSISVKDSGKGIAEENLGKIFEPFFSTKGIGEGSGLGLAICYGIMQKHNGSISVKSVPGLGTTFDLMLPVQS